MAKPPKPVSGISPLPDTPPIHRNTSTGEPDVHRLPVDHPVPNPAAESQTATDASQHAPAAVSRAPSVQVSELPQAGALTADQLLNSITWPADRLHLLNALDAASGLFHSPAGKLFAHVENEGHILVERQHDGRYQIPFNLGPQLPGPFLSKSERQPTWRVERPQWLTQSPEPDSRRTAAGVPEPAQTPSYLAPADATRLSAAEDTADGIRYDKHRKTYVDTAEGTVMVRKTAAGAYQQAFATLMDAPDVYFERIADTRLWRRKIGETLTVPEDHRPRPPSEIEAAAPGPSKRTQADDAASSSQSLTDSLLATHPQALNLSFGLWRNWGKTQPSLSGQYIEIDGLHYRIVQQVLNGESRLAYLQHPAFSPTRYDAFESMLRDNPSLQPKWAVKRNAQWIVLDRRFPFEMPITQYIATTFRHLSDQAVRALASAMFNQANKSEIISGHGLAVINQTFRYWLDRQGVRPPHGELADPLLMLRSLGNDRDASVAIPLGPSSAEGLQQLDFDPGRFPHYWNEYAAAPTVPLLRRLFSDVLEDDGYTISAAHHPFEEHALLFHRQTLDAVFILEFPVIIDGRLQRPTAPFFDQSGSLSSSRITAQQQTIESFRKANQIIYLLGGVQTDSMGQATLFMIRER